MLVRTKRNERVTHRRRPLRGPHTADHTGAQAEPESGEVAPERRHGGPSEDRALYSCECGYAFEAPVTTSVGCPHCARTQAW